MAADPRRFLHRRGAEVALLPLRAFLGATFVFAGLQKLSDPRFFDAGAASSIQTQLRASQRTSPVGSVLHGAVHLAVLMGVVIALMEIAVGLGALLGLWTKWAAAGGAALSAGFLLAVSWHAHPYYYGSDIVFLFAWTPLLIGGAGVFSVDALLRDRARRDLSIPPFGPVEIDFGVVRKLCGAYDAGRCNQRGGAPCAVEPCPVLARQVVLKPAVRDELDRRAFLLRARTVGGIGAATLVLGGATAVLGRPVRAGAQGDPHTEAQHARGTHHDDARTGDRGLRSDLGAEREPTVHRGAPGGHGDRPGERGPRRERGIVHGSFER
ncbi:MAG: DoxX family protein [Acidimicrobiia bacterium]